jgi:2-dehydro-3-deoxyphosphogluconate aldolase / (4S)-4-hydroxy-2-oxoglutarate aldolase
VTAAPRPAPEGVLAQLARLRIVPVIIIDDLAAARPLADALAGGGLGCVEITLRTPDAVTAITRFAGNDRLLVGAGTILEPDQARAAVDAGARFVVSPGFDGEVVHCCQELGVPVLPGAATPTEIQQAQRAGLTAVKFFPAETLGGVTALDAMSGPFSGMTFAPTGGITAAKAPAYLQHRAVLAIGGSWMAPRKLIAAGDWQGIGQLAVQAAGLAAKYPVPPTVVAGLAADGQAAGAPAISGQQDARR